MQSISSSGEEETRAQNGEKRITRNSKKTREIRGQKTASEGKTRRGQNRWVTKEEGPILEEKNKGVSVKKHGKNGGGTKEVSVYGDSKKGRRHT